MEGEFRKTEHQRYESLQRGDHLDTLITPVKSRRRKIEIQTQGTQEAIQKTLEKNETGSEQ